MHSREQRGATGSSGEQRGAAGSWLECTQRRLNHAELTLAYSDRNGIL